MYRTYVSHIMVSPGGTEALVIRTAFRQHDVVSQAVIVTAGVVVPILLFGYAGFAWVSSGSADAAVFPAAFGAVFIAALLGEIAPQTLRLRNGEIVRETIWTRVEIGLTDIERVAVTKNKPGLVAIASKGGTLIAVRAGFSEADKTQLAGVLRARLPSEVPFEEFEGIPLGWGSENEDEAQRHRETRYRLGLRIIIGLGSLGVFSALGLTTLILWSGSKAFGGFMLLVIASLALLLVTVATGRRTYMTHGALLMGIAMLLLTGYPVFAG